MVAVPNFMIGASSRAAPSGSDTCFDTRSARTIPLPSVASFDVARVVAGRVWLAVHRTVRRGEPRRCRLRRRCVLHGGAARSTPSAATCSGTVHVACLSPPRSAPRPRPACPLTFDQSCFRRQRRFRLRFRCLLRDGVRRGSVLLRRAVGSTLRRAGGSPVRSAAMHGFRGAAVRAALVLSRLRRCCMLRNRVRDPPLLLRDLVWDQQCAIAPRCCAVS